ncbi:MAG: DNA cytosine methyltransferase [Planctomycetes bacterium]|nr:DNA cytosine methyltransferase [Planctomycetota bacterium]
MGKKRPTVVDLFAGAGGLSEGFLKKGFEVVAYVEKDNYACQTLQTRHVYWETKSLKMNLHYQKYIQGLISREEFLDISKTDNPVINQAISKETLPEIIATIKNRMKKSGTKTIDVFIGGPPCQAYSLVGRARDPYGMKRDSRNILYKYYVELLKEFQPKMFVFENVPGILSAGNGKLWEDVQKYFQKAGYEIGFRMLDASDFMVPQRRKRVILMGWRKRLKLAYPEFAKMPHSFTVKDVLSDLPVLQAGESVFGGDYKTTPTEYLRKTGIRTKEKFLIQHITRPLNKRDSQIYKKAIELWSSKKERLNYNQLPDNLKTHKNQHSFVDRFKIVAADMPYSHTVVAHISKDGHYYIHPDKKQLRSLSVREAARIQSFPDNYKFEGPRTAQFAQIGNAVPPLMAESIAIKVKEMLL